MIGQWSRLPIANLLFCSFLPMLVRVCASDQYPTCVCVCVKVWRSVCCWGLPPEFAKHHFGAHPDNADHRLRRLCRNMVHRSNSTSLRCRSGCTCRCSSCCLAAHMLRKSISSKSCDPCPCMGPEARVESRHHGSLCRWQAVGVL